MLFLSVLLDLQHSSFHHWGLLRSWLIKMYLFNSVHPFSSSSGATTPMGCFSGCSVHMRENERAQGKWCSLAAVAWLLTAAIQLKKWAWPSHSRGLENNYTARWVYQTENIFMCSHIMAIKKPHEKGNVNSIKMWKKHKEKIILKGSGFI